MTHEIAKLLLEHAETFLERTEAIKAALSLGMPLNEIQDYLDWLDALRGKARKSTASPRRTAPGSSVKRSTTSGGQESADASR